MRKLIDIPIPELFDKDKLFISYPPQWFFELCQEASEHLQRPITIVEFVEWFTHDRIDSKLLDIHSNTTVIDSKPHQVEANYDML